MQIDINEQLSVETAFDRAVVIREHVTGTRILIEPDEIDDLIDALQGAKAVLMSKGNNNSTTRTKIER